MEMSSKVFNDPIHGSIELPDICVAIIDTPEFQRLRHIKQLGLTCLVYPTAVHTRFDHSIGVCHLADEMVRALRRQHASTYGVRIDITEKERFCVMIAGLCRNLGFGPFSHLFDQKFMKNKGKEYTHGAMSAQIFGEIAKRPRVKELLQTYKLDEEVKFIQELINPPQNLWEKDGLRTKYKNRWCCEGRGEDKSFLYLIVKNTLNGIDVSEWDSCARDCLFLGIPNSFDHQRLLKFSKVLKWGGRYEICFKLKETLQLHNLYRMRHVLHTHAYQHQAKNTIETMFSEALEEAEKALDNSPDDVFLNMLFGKGNLSGKVDNVQDFLSLTDDIYQKILFCPHPAMSKAKEILQNIQERQLYKIVVETPYSDSVNEDELSPRCWEALQVLDPSFRSMAYIETVHCDFRLNREEPLRNVHFFTKSNPDIPTLSKEDPDKEPHVLPRNVLLERKLKVYCKSTETSCRDKIYECLRPWWAEHHEAKTLIDPPPSPRNVQSPTTPLSGRNPYTEFKFSGIYKPGFKSEWEDQPSISGQQDSRRSTRIAQKRKRDEDDQEPPQEDTSMQQKGVLQRCFDVVVEEARNVWKDIARGLDLTQVDIESTDLELRGKCSECTRAILNQWATREGKGATIQWLMNALESAGRVDVKQRVGEIANELEG